MMNQIWLQVFAVLIGGSIIKYVFQSAVMWVIIDLAVLAVVYFMLKRYPYIDLKKCMGFLGALTGINVLVDIGILTAGMGNIAVLGVLVWMLFQQGGFGGGRRPRR